MSFCLRVFQSHSQVQSTGSPVLLQFAGWPACMKQEGAVGWCPSPVCTRAYFDPFTPLRLTPSHHCQALGVAHPLAILFHLHFVLFLTLGNLYLVFEQAFLAFSFYILCVFIICLEQKGWPSHEFTVPS